MRRLPKWLLAILALALLLGWSTTGRAQDVIKGKIKLPVKDKRQVVVVDTNGKEWTFEVKEDAKIRSGSKVITFDDLKEGAEVEVTYKKNGDTKLKATEISVTK